MTTPARVDSQNPDTEGRGVRCYASERRAKASQSLVGWGIDIEIAIGIEQRRNANGPRTREIGRLPAGDRLRSLGLRESRDAGRRPSYGTGLMAACQSIDTDTDPDSDSDLDEDKPQKRGGVAGIPSP